jgi:hypothetical protein
MYCIQILEGTGFGKKKKSKEGGSFAENKEPFQIQTLQG